MSAPPTWMPLPRLSNLPNEILVAILTPFLTTELLHVAVVCRRFHALVVRILHLRLVLAPSLPEYKLILEAFHPSHRNLDPHLFCTHLRTDDTLLRRDGNARVHGHADAHVAADDSGGGGAGYDNGSLGRLNLLYSRFRPERPVVAATMPPRRIAGAPLQALDGNGNPAVRPLYRNAGDGGTERVLHSIHLDSEELFGQFCVYSSLVKLGPRRGVFLGIVPIVKPNQGTMRVWKTWLCERAREEERRRRRMMMMMPLSQQQEQQQYQHRPAPLQQTEQTDHSPISKPGSARYGLDDEADSSKNIMWTDSRKNVGIKVAVCCRDRVCHQDLADLDSVPLSFTLEIQELVVRTTHLMLAVESSTYESESLSRRALIFGNFATPGSE